MKRTHSLSASFGFSASRIASVLLIVCLCVSSTPAAPQAMVALANESALSFYFWFHNRGLRKLIQGQSAPKAKSQEKQSTRDAKISRIQIFPSDLTIDLNDRVVQQ